jgi:hypothetical protein
MFGMITEIAGNQATRERIASHGEINCSVVMVQLCVIALGNLEILEQTD